jgi:hypothetical protein
MVYRPPQQGMQRQTGCWPYHVVDSSVRSSRQSWQVVALDPRGVSHATIRGGLIWEIRGAQLRVAMRARGLMAVPPASGHQVFTDTVPLAGAGDDVDVARGAPLPGHREACAGCSVSPPLGGKPVSGL